MRREGGKERGLRQIVRHTAPEGHPLVSSSKAGDGEVVLVRVEARDKGKWGRSTHGGRGLGIGYFPQC